MVRLRILLVLAAAAIFVLALLLIAAGLFGRAGWTAVLGLAFIGIGWLGLAARRAAVRDVLRGLMGVRAGSSSGVHLALPFAIAYIIFGVVWLALAVRYAVR